MTTQIGAFVGATGGAGTTRLTLETGVVLAETGRDVAIFDASFQTQGLGSFLDTEIERDVTTLLTEDVPLETALTAQPLDTPGTLSVCPAIAPFERLSRAKTAGAANRFEEHLAAATLSHDIVLVDTPPIGGNQAIAAVNAADHVGIITPDTRRGDDALALTRERLIDIGCSPDAVLANRSDGSVVVADAHVPATETTDPRQCPSALQADDEFTDGVLDGIEALFGFRPEIERSERSRFSVLS